MPPRIFCSRLTKRPSTGWLHEVAGSDRSAESLVDEAYLRTLNRPPEAEEIQRSVQHIEAAPTRVEGLRDLLWALLNGKEFIFNH